MIQKPAEKPKGKELFDRIRIEKIWRKAYNIPDSQNLIASPRDWSFWLSLLNHKG